MEIGGPARGSDLLKTKYSPDGTRTRGTLNNCAHGVTPWNTYLAAEENWAGYFANTDKIDQKPDLPREHARYGVSTSREGGRYGWHLAESGADEYAALMPRPRARTRPRITATSRTPSAGWSRSRFEWDLFVIAGGAASSADLQGNPLDETNIFACPDGHWIDDASRVWIETDIGESAQNRGDFEQFGNNAMLCANPVTGEIRRFLTGPIGQEITGVITMPDQRTMFINVQHPGATATAEDCAADRHLSHWPEGGNAWLRSATVVITKEDGGVIGT